MATRLSHRVATPAPTGGLWAAMADRFRGESPIPTVEVAELSPRASMFDYDPDRAVAVSELPASLG